MGGNMSLIKDRRPRRTGDDAYYGPPVADDSMSARKIRPFENDKGPFVAVKPDPRVDIKAEAYIDKVRAQISESERQTCQQAAGKAA